MDEIVVDLKQVIQFSRNPSIVMRLTDVTYQRLVDTVEDPNEKFRTPLDNDLVI